MQFLYIFPDESQGYRLFFIIEIQLNKNVGERMRNFIIQIQLNKKVGERMRKRSVHFIYILLNVVVLPWYFDVLLLKRSVAFVSVFHYIVLIICETFHVGSRTVDELLF